MIETTHLPYSKSFRIKYSTKEEVQRIKEALVKGGIEPKEQPYTG